MPGLKVECGAGVFCRRKVGAGGTATTTFRPAIRPTHDAHCTVQQIYVNLQHNVRVSEVYYVLDGFLPGRDTPFFMYDNLIVIGATEIPFKASDAASSDDMPPEHEEDEYRYFTMQLEWFRRHAPTFEWSHTFDNAELRERGERLHRLSSELAHALERSEFVLFYQPKASLVDGRVVSLEALLRWRHPRMGLISPAEFIPILERGGGIIEVGAWVIEQSCRDLARLSAEGHGEMLIGANVSVRQLRRGNLHETVVGILERNATDPARLVLEVTESTMMENLDEGRQLLMRLTALGIRLAIDDFGAGYSSPTYLQNLPLSYLKLNKSFIDGMVNPRAQHIVRTVIMLAKGLALKTIAEGIETPQQRDALAEMGCDIMQGYLLSKPRPLDDIVLWLRAAERP